MPSERAHAVVPEELTLAGSLHRYEAILVTLVEDKPGPATSISVGGLDPAALDDSGCQRIS
jgi:hypothetical protein